MTEVLHVPDHEMQSYHDCKVEFKKDVQSGLAQNYKQLSSKYFYDDYGCELFNEITRHPDYYLTGSEVEILNTYKQDIADLMHNQAFNLIELGPGEGIKTQILVQQFLQDHLNFTYLPIDISTQYLKTLVRQFKQSLPQLNITPVHSDYFRGLAWLSSHSTRQNFVLFLGSSIGNFDPCATHVFLRHLWEVLNEGDYVLLGFDLRKDVDILMRAYNDDDGITRDFNLNLLKRINRELNADFVLDKFRHYATYNVHSGAMESYLLSLEKQTVTIPALQNTFEFEAIEPIHVEYSYKYLLSQINELAAANGFVSVRHFVDKRDYFVDALWRVVKK